MMCVYAELFTLQDSTDNFQPMTIDDLLAASQAQVIYIMMMVMESGMRRLEWVREMLVMCGVHLQARLC